MTVSQPLISVIMPVYNGARFLRAAIQSVLNQTYQQVEILVVDDGSEDESPQIAKNFRNVRTLCQKHQGVASARNSALDLARGDYIAFLDSDDLWEPEKLELQMKVMLSPSGPELLCCRFKNFFERDVEIPLWVKSTVFCQEKAGYMPSPCTLVTKSSIFKKIGKFNSSLTTGSDLDWFARVKDAGISIPVLPAVLVKRRLHDKNLCYSARSDQSHLIRIMRESIQRKKNRENPHKKQV